jgi:hypothetical protein
MTSRLRAPAWSLLLAIGAVGLAGCGKTEPAPDPLKAQRNAIQKAKGVDDTVGAAAARMREKIDEAETK